MRDVAPLDVCDSWEGEIAEAASNPLGLHACYDTDVLLLWCTNCSGEGGEQQCGWVVIGVEDSELPEWILDVACLEDATDDCGLKKKVKSQKRYGHFCECEDDPDEYKASEATGDWITYLSDIEIGEASNTEDVLSDVECGTGCSISFSGFGIGEATLTLKTRTACVLCARDKASDDLTGPTVAVMGESIADKTLAGTELDVLVSAELGYTGSGGSGDGCPPGSGSAGATITITGKTKKVCTFCSADGEGNFEDGVDIDLLDGLSFGLIVAISEADFTCSPCPSLSTKYQTGYVLCVTEESEALVSSCTCIDCEEGSGSGA